MEIRRDKYLDKSFEMDDRFMKVISESEWRTLKMALSIVADLQNLLVNVTGYLLYTDYVYRQVIHINVTNHSFYVFVLFSKH